MPRRTQIRCRTSRLSQRHRVECAGSNQSSKLNVDSAILLYINNEKMRNNCSICIKKIKSAANVEQFRYVGLEPQAATGSSMELTLG